MHAVNAALNYPAVTYPDIALFFDQAIAEINTTLHTGLRSFHDCMDLAKERRRELMAKAVVLDTEPTPADRIEAGDESDATAGEWEYYYNTEHKKYGRLFGGIYEYSDKLYGVYCSTTAQRTVYEAFAFNDATVVWVVSKDAYDFDVSEFLPEDWIVLFIIPYVCFKYTVRDGGTATTFAEELGQGFQQLQETYDVPEKVWLPSVSHLPAYTEDVKKHIPLLNVMIPTRAIYESMKHDRATNGTYGSMYDRNGFGDDPWPWGSL